MEKAQTVTATNYTTLENFLNVQKELQGKDLYGHLKQVMSHLVRHTHPDESLNKLEEVSYLLKNPEKCEQFLRTSVAKDYARPNEDKETAQTLNAIIEHAKTFFPQVEVKKDEEGNEVPAEIAPINFLPDLRSDSKIYEWAGVSFGEYETMLLQKSLQKQVAASGATTLRLWGKIRGTQKDYYIAEGSLEGGAAEGEGEPPADFEPRGTGVNKFVYWATNSPMDAWTQLPDLKPVDIINARSIKHSFSGNLDQKIFTNPFYDNTEKVYLRAQIARIAHSTTLVPKGLFRFQEENDREIEDNTPEEGEIQKPQTKDMIWMDMWQHLTPSILQQGRLTHMPGNPLPGEEDVEPEELLKREVTKDPWEPRLKSISADSKTKGDIPAWVLKTFGVKDSYLDGKTNTHRKNFGTVLVKSMVWPGAYVFYHQERCMHIYVGDGQKYESETYYPICPPVMHEEHEEKQCWGEPNPTQEWLDYVESQKGPQAPVAEGDEE